MCLKSRHIDKNRGKLLDFSLPDMASKDLASKPLGFPVPLWVSLGMDAGIAPQVVVSKGVFYGA